MVENVRKIGCLAESVRLATSPHPVGLRCACDGRNTPSSSHPPPAQHTIRLLFTKDWLVVFLVGGCSACEREAADVYAPTTRLRDPADSTPQSRPMNEEPTAHLYPPRRRE